MTSLIHLSEAFVARTYTRAYCDQGHGSRADQLGRIHIKDKTSAFYAQSLLRNTEGHSRPGWAGD